MKDTFTLKDDNFNYDDNENEAVVYFANKSGKTRKENLFVMKRNEAIKFINNKQTKGNNWMLLFTTHKRDWRNYLKTFRKDDGRFDDLLEELNITPIYRLR